MSHITRGKRDKEYEDYLEELERRKQNHKYNFEPEEKKVVYKEDFKTIKKMRKLFNIVKNFVRQSEQDKNSCSIRCEYIDKKSSFCKLFGISTTNLKRCKTCIDIFGK